MPRFNSEESFMSNHLPKFVNRKEAAHLLADTAEEFAVVHNPSYVHPPFDLYPLPPRKKDLDRGLRAVVMDMDGTTTTTEALCIHSLETMVRRITGRLSHGEWEGLNPDRDYPHIIGNSTTKHVEYLVRTYQEAIDPKSFRLFGLMQAAWTLANSQDETRKEEVVSNLHSLGAGDLLEDGQFRDLVLGEEELEELDEEHLSEVAENLLGGCELESFSNQVRLAIDIYYHRYHEILRDIKLGEGALLAEEILGSRGIPLIEPMPGIAVFLSLVKGWLGRDAAQLIDELADVLPEPPTDGKDKLRELGVYFEKNPAKVGVVTSSIRYEAEIVLNEVFGVLRKEIHDWDLEESKKERIFSFFESPDRYYDAFVTATDSSEIRLKPHRDLYSIALHRLGVPADEFDRVVGFEDSESGTIAIRAAGIPLCVAVPFAESGGHDFDAASHVCPGGLPEVMLRHGVFLTKEVLEEGIKA